MGKEGGRLSFPVRQLDLTNFVQGEAMGFDVDMDNAKPFGHIHARGKLGPILPKDLGKTAANGDFTFDSVVLHDVGNIRGTLASAGRFRGTLSAIEADAAANAPDFAVDDGNATPVAASIRCTVNATNGDVSIDRIEAKVETTVIHAVGTIAGSPKITNLDITADSGRAEDILRPFMHKQVPVVGPVRLKSHAYIGPSGDPFLERLRVDGFFDIPTERLTNKTTEKNLTAFSARAQGANSQGSEHKSELGTDVSSADVLSSVKGPAQIRNGIISSPHLVFEVPGAEANLSGTFALQGQIVQLRGDLKMESDISHAATGFKSVLLKPLAPFFRKRDAGAVVPIAVIGSSGSYRVTQDISHDK